MDPFAPTPLYVLGGTLLRCCESATTKHWSTFKRAQIQLAYFITLRVRVSQCREARSFVPSNLQGTRRPDEDWVNSAPCCYLQGKEALFAVFFGELWGSR